MARGKRGRGGKGGRGGGQRIQLSDQHPDPRLIRRAVEVLEGGGLVAYPTDTTYGIGCDATQKKAVDRIYEAKRMKADQPLAFLCADLGEVARYAVVDDAAYRLMRRLTPGPYTFILRSTREAPKALYISKKRRTVGIRIPHHEVALSLLRELGRPLVSSTASREDEVFNDPGDIMEAFPGVDMILDAGWGGLVPSTVLDLTDDSGIEVVREGAGPIDFL
jgi:tRNA threonylcarbamoyl adenosine modification protein (Sua5/YciO/YrdC/YwlC family)